MKIKIFFISLFLLCLILCFSSCDSKQEKSKMIAQNTEDVPPLDESTNDSDLSDDSGTDNSDNDADVHEHTFGEWFVIKEATCTENGQREKTCDFCEEKRTETIYANGHIEETIPGKDATCIESGLTDGKRCTVCQKITVEQTSISPGHTYIDGMCSVCEELEPSQGLVFTLSDDGESYSVSGAYCKESNVFIPSIYNKKPVTCISSGAFWCSTTLETIELPDTITEIKGSAFYFCTSLKSIKIPEGVSVIEGNAFSGCESLTSIEIPISVVTIGRGAFSGAGLTTLTVGEGVETIENSAFSACSKLKNVIISKSVKSIEINAFAYCYTLETFEVNSVISNLDVNVFYDSYNIKYNEYGNGCYLGNSTNPYLILVKGKDTTITSFTVHKDTAMISNHAFDYHYGIESVTIPDNVIYLGKFAFRNCGMKSVTLGSGLKEISEGAFRDCYNLKNIVIPNGITSIGDSAFESCDDLVTLNIPSNVEVIGNSAFRECTMLANVTINKGVKIIGEYAFYHCIFIERITIPDSVTSIGAYAFQYNFLSSIEIPDSVKSIGDYAFANGGKLKSVKIGKGVDTMGKYVFKDCNSQLVINCKANEMPTGWDVNWNSDKRTVYWGQ